MLRKSLVAACVLLGMLVMQSVAQTTFVTPCTGVSAENSCTNKEQPYCMDISPMGKAPVMRCVECRDMCDCAPDQYCNLDRSKGEQGKCLPYETTIEGTACTATVTDGDPKNVQKDIDGSMFCGKLVYDARGYGRQILWKGVCVRNRCQVCGLNNEKESVCSSHVMRQVIASRPQRYCENGKWVDQLGEPQTRYTSIDLTRSTDSVEAAGETLVAVFLAILAVAQSMLMCKK